MIRLYEIFEQFYHSHESNQSKVIWFKLDKYCKIDERGFIENTYVISLMNKKHRCCSDNDYIEHMKQVKNPMMLIILNDLIDSIGNSFPSANKYSVRFVKIATYLIVVAVLVATS